MKSIVYQAAALLFLATCPIVGAAAADDRFTGNHYRGRGDVEYLQLLDTAARMLHPDPEFQNMSMLYMPSWNGLVEGSTWDAWWIQNSYGTTYCALPFFQEPFVSFLQNSQDLWFDKMGDGKRKGEHDWIGPDGCLCDCANVTQIYYKQGDGRIQIHDWGMEFTAAGIVMQSELLLISRDKDAIQRYLPKLERCANFIDTRRDPKTNMFLAGPAGNLLAPSYAGWKKPDGTYGQAYLAGLSVTYIAGLNRLVELEKMAGRTDKVMLYAQRGVDALKGLAAMTTPEGYLVRSIDPDGEVHGIYGAPKHGYLETSPNHDAIAFRVVNDEQAEKIYQKIASIPQLRPHDFILPNYPSYDDMYEKAEGLWGYGTWVNGGHWSTCEARMDLAYMRLGHYEDARRSLKQLMTFARRFRMDNPLTEMGANVYQPKEPINLCYDTFGPAVGVMRGLFEYIYSVEGLKLIPHIPQGITELEQLDPVRFGSKQVFISVTGSGRIRNVSINGQSWRGFDDTSVMLWPDQIPDRAYVKIVMGPQTSAQDKPADPQPGRQSYAPRVLPIRRFRDILEGAGMGQSYEAAHARLCEDAWAAAEDRQEMLKAGKLSPIPEPSQSAADKSYFDAANKLCEGLEKVLNSYQQSQVPRQKAIYQLWLQTQTTKQPPPPPAPSR